MNEPGAEVVQLIAGGKKSGLFKGLQSLFERVGNKGAEVSASDTGGAIVTGSPESGERIVTQNHHWWPKELGGADKTGATVPIKSKNPNLHTASGGIHPEMHSYFKNLYGTDTWKSAKSEFFKQDFKTQQELLRDFYQTQGMDMPTMIAPGVVK